MPPSPKRKASGGLEREVEKEKEGNDGDGFPSSTPTSSGAATRAAFPFKGNYKPLPQDAVANSTVGTHNPTRSTTIMPAPPMIISPGQKTEGGENIQRSSQIIYRTGFINRQPNAPPPLQYSTNHFPLTLSKGWKPFKLELKGSKLYFYKPPGDRNTAIRDLFPTELVPSLESEVLGSEEEEPDYGRKGKESSTGRKKRSYWGRKTHPDLVLNEREILYGTFDALIHEAVFATQFRPFPDAGGVDGQTGKWKEFASSILLCLPPLAGRKRFEIEFARCCSYLVSGVDEEAKPTETSRVGWLAGEYLRYQGSPTDIRAWDEWVAETIPHSFAAEMHGPISSAIPHSSSMQALYMPSPEFGFGSPNIGTFSPRPDESKMLSLVQALGVPAVAAAKPPPRMSTLDSQHQEQRPLHCNLTSPTKPQIPWAALERDGLSRDLLFLLDPQLVARSLCLFHRGVFEQTPENLTADFVINSDNAPSMIPDSDEPIFPTSFIHLFGTEEQPHWLTRLLLLQILGTDTFTGHIPHFSSPASVIDDRNIHTSRTHSRSEVISVWVKIGELCRLAGDECSWRAIVAALCSRPVARLDKVWKRVDPQAMAAVESWIYPSLDGECVSIQEPRTTAWGGDLKSRIEVESQKARGDGEDEMWNVGLLEKTRDMFDGLRTAFSLCPRKKTFGSEEEDEETNRMVLFWREMAARGGIANSHAPQLLR